MALNGALACFADVSPVATAVGSLLLKSVEEQQSFVKQSRDSLEDCVSAFWKTGDASVDTANLFPCLLATTSCLIGWGCYGLKVPKSAR